MWNTCNKKTKFSLCEISQSNILDYKRRSKLVSKTYCFNTNKTVINEMDTLKNCYNYLYDLKNTLSDYISIVRGYRKFSKTEKDKLMKILDESKIEIISSCNIYKNYKEKNKVNYTLKEKRDLNKMIKKITEVSNVVVLLSNDIKIYF